MTRYAVPAKTNQKVFRIFAYGSIGLMLIFLVLSQSERQELNDGLRHALGWGAVGLLIVFMAGVFLLVAKNSVQRAWQNEAFALADQKIVRLIEGGPSIELALTEIQFLGEGAAPSFCRWAVTPNSSNK